MTDQPEEIEIEINTRPDHHGLGVEHPGEKPKRRRLLRVAGSLLLLLVVLVALAPVLLSTGPGTRLVVSLINKQVGGTVEIDDLSLGWFSGQRIVGLRYDDPAAGLNAEVGEIDASELGLFDLLTGGRRLGAVRIVDTVITYAASDAAMADKPGQDEGKGGGDGEPFALPPGLSGSLQFENLGVVYAAADAEPVRVSLPTGGVSAPDLRDIKLDFDASVMQGKNTGRLVISGEVLNLFDPDGVLRPLQAGYQVSARAQGVPTAALGQIVGRPGLVTALLGEGAIEADVTANGAFEELAAELEITAPNLRVSLLQGHEGDVLIAKPESTARLTLTQEGFAALFPDSGLSLKEASTVELASLALRLPHDDERFDWDAASMSLEIKAGDDLALRDEKGEVIGVNKLRIGGGGASIAKELAFDISATLSAVDEAGAVTSEPIKAELTVERPLEDDRRIEFFSGSLPIKLADALSGQKGKLVLYLGEMLALQAELVGKVQRDEAGNNRVSYGYALRPEGRVTGEVTGALDGGRYTLATADKAPVQATLVPEAFADLMEIVSGVEGRPALTIDKPMPVYLTLRDAERGEVSVMTDPTKDGVERFYPDPDRTYAGATLEFSPATVFDPKRKTTYELRGGTVSLKAPDLRGRVEVEARIDLWVRPDAGKQGIPALLTWQTSVTDLLDTDGAVPLDSTELMKQIGLSGGVSLKDVPSDLFDSLLNQEGDVASILGPIVQEMQADFTYSDGQPTGASVKLNWDAANNRPLPDAWASLKPVKFDIDKNQMMTVAGGQDIELEVNVTEEFGRRWMGKLHPILLDARSSDRPVTVKIDGASFRFPLNDEQMVGSNVKAEVDLGSLQFGKGSLLSELLKWTRKPGEHAVFEKATVELVDGKISYDKFGMTVGNVQLKLDGEVDVVSGQIVDMAVRVPGSSLIRVFNELEGIIAPGDFLSIPMSGPINKPRFDAQLIPREVARMVATGLIKKETDRFFDKLKKKVFDQGEQKPATQPKDGSSAQPEPADQTTTPEEAGGELIDNALDLIFGGGKRRQQEQQEQQEQQGGQ